MKAGPPRVAYRKRFVIVGLAAARLRLQVAGNGDAAPQFW
jgi:hypothetical protein